MPVLFDSLTLGRMQLANRIVMAPMTRSRANDDDRVGDLLVEYYRQRASAGLIIFERTQPSPVAMAKVIVAPRASIMQPR